MRLNRSTEFLDRLLNTINRFFEPPITLDPNDSFILDGWVNNGASDPDYDVVSAITYRDFELD